MKAFTTEELTITIAAMEAATSMRVAMATMAPDRHEDFADLVAEFALDETVPTFDEEIAMAKAELASRAN